MRKYNTESKINEIEQRLCNVVSYVLFLYEKNIITERTKNEILKLCNPEVYKEGAFNGRRL